MHARQLVHAVRGVDNAGYGGGEGGGRGVCVCVCVCVCMCVCMCVCIYIQAANEASSHGTSALVEQQLLRIRQANSAKEHVDRCTYL